MSEFDYTALFKGAFAAMREEQPGNRIAPAAAYLRTRIKAAFVPNRTVELLGECMENLTARAEAAEARNKVLEEALRAVDALIDQDDAARDVIAQALGAEHGK